MKYEVRTFKSMALALPELRQIIHSPMLLEKGRPIDNFGGLHPRELVANWLICAVVNYERGIDALRFSTDPTTNECDGLIIDTERGEVFFTEHVFVSKRDSGGTEELISERIKNKNDRGAAYAEGKTLIVFTNGGAGDWYPNAVAKKIERPFHFTDVWVIALQNGGANGVYIYGIARLNLDLGQSWIWKVEIEPDFDRWAVCLTQEVCEAPPIA